MSGRSQTLAADFCTIRRCDFLAEGEFIPPDETRLQFRLFCCETHRRSHGPDLERMGWRWEQWVPAPATATRLQMMAEGRYG